MAWRCLNYPSNAVRCNLRYLLKTLFEKIFAFGAYATAMGAGALALLCFWTAIDHSQGIPRWDSNEWLSILYIGIAGGALSFFLYSLALGQAAPTVTMITLPLNPIAAVIAGALFLKEPLNLDLFMGLALVIIGILLVVGINLNRTRVIASGAEQ